MGKITSWWGTTNFSDDFPPRSLLPLWFAMICRFGYSGSVLPAWFMSAANGTTCSSTCIGPQLPKREDDEVITARVMTSRRPQKKEEDRHQKDPPIRTMPVASCSRIIETRRARKEKYSRALDPNKAKTPLTHEASKDALVYIFLCNTRLQF